MNSVEDEMICEQVLLDTSELERVTRKVSLEKSAERRRHFRKPARWTVTGLLSEGRTFKGMLEDISESGLLMMVGAPKAKGQRAYLKIMSFVGGQRKMLDAIVVFRHISLSGDIYRVGCEFVHMSNEVREFISIYVRGGELSASPEKADPYQLFGTNR